VGSASAEGTDCWSIDLNVFLEGLDVCDGGRGEVRGQLDDIVFKWLYITSRKSCILIVTFVRV